MTDPSYRRIRGHLLAAAFGLFALVGCRTVPRETCYRIYDGPERPHAEVAYLIEGMGMHIWEVDGRNIRSARWEDRTSAQILPGKHMVLFKYRIDAGSIIEASAVGKEFEAVAGHTYVIEKDADPNWYHPRILDCGPTKFTK